MKFLFLACTAFLFFATNLPAQNLVPNPGFEEITSCPQGLSVDSTGIEKAKYWFTTDKNCSPDLYNECTVKEWRGPDDPPKVSPKSGKGYAGFQCPEERMEVKLKSPLVKNKAYRVQMYVCDPYNLRSLFSYPSILKFCFTKGALTKKYVYNFVVDNRSLWVVKNPGNKSYPGRWQLFSTRYIAKGGENYFTFGRLDSSLAFDTKLYFYDGQVDPFKAYYYCIDDVSVEEDTTVSASPPAAFKGKLVAGQKLTLKNIYFETAKANLLSVSDKELDTLAKAMQNNSSVSLSIFGYTDSTGNEANNIELSTKRAEAVRNYLVNEGIALKRLNYKGLGSANPVAGNKTEEGRKSNRRVEIEVTGTR